VGLGARRRVLRRRLDEDAALLAVYLDVPLGDVEIRRG
jgi:hypothetical protein